MKVPSQTDDAKALGAAATIYRGTGSVRSGRWGFEMADDDTVRAATRPWRAIRCGGWMPSGARRTICRSGRSTCMDNPLLREPLQPEHIKPRLLGHWGTTPGLNFIYVHLNRVIKQRDLNMIYVAGPGHGGPGLVANTYLEGHLQRVLSEHLAGRRRACSGCSRSSPFPAAFRATWRRKRRARSTKAANSATRCCMPTARRSTIRI